uniref:Secreted protein n=1 Tax=Anopheles coluzzii TaxID=1518534 RepID=A0A8W7PTM7_ANOCL
MIAFFTSVLVRISSLFDALYTTSMMRALRAIPSDPQAKLPESRRRARNFLLPPRALLLGLLPLQQRLDVVLDGEVDELVLSFRLHHAGTLGAHHLNCPLNVNLTLVT